LKYSRVIVLAPGSTLKNEVSKVIEEIDESTCVIAVNFIPENYQITLDYVFLTNMKRYDAIRNRRNNIKLIITSNLFRDIEDFNFAIAYNELAFFKGEYCDDSTLMLLNLLNKIGVSIVSFAGFDGRKDGKLNFVDDSFDRNKMKTSASSHVRDILYSAFPAMEKTFITESEYQQDKE
jgi:4-hydroxy 2-oxovalerate aldolase